MANGDRVHDREMLDILETLDPVPFHADAWRVVRSGRDALRGSTANGRWGTSGEFEVLYTACAQDGALAEIGYRLSLEPIWPSKLDHMIHKIEVDLDRVLDLTDFAILGQFGIHEDRYEGHEYAAEQALSAAARFLEVQGILVPNARHACNNLVIYPNVDGALTGITHVESAAIDWNAWRGANRTRPSRRK